MELLSVKQSPLFWNMNREYVWCACVCVDVCNGINFQRSKEFHVDKTTFVSMRTHTELSAIIPAAKVNIPIRHQPPSLSFYILYRFFCPSIIQLYFRFHHQRNWWVNSLRIMFHIQIRLYACMKRILLIKMTSTSEKLLNSMFQKKIIFNFSQKSTFLQSHLWPQHNY